MSEETSELSPPTLQRLSINAKTPFDELSAGFARSVFARQFRCGFGFVIPAKAGIQKQRDKHTVWMPACAGMTVAGWFEIELACKAARSPKPKAES